MGLQEKETQKDKGIQEICLKKTYSTTEPTEPLSLTPTQSPAGGMLLYIISHLSYKPCPDLNIYKANQLESTFAEIIKLTKSHIVIGYLYKHPNMEVLDYLSQIFEIVSKEQKQIFLLGDFKINLLNYNGHQPRNDFLGSLASNSYSICLTSN